LSKLRQFFLIYYAPLSKSILQCLGQKSKAALYADHLHAVLSWNLIGMTSLSCAWGASYERASSSMGFCKVAVNMYHSIDSWCMCAHAYCSMFSMFSHVIDWDFVSVVCQGGRGCEWI